MKLNNVEYLLPYWREIMIEESPREFVKNLNQYKYKAEWLSLDI